LAAGLKDPSAAQFKWMPVVVTERDGSAKTRTDGLNSQGIPTARGQGKWTATQVTRVLERLA
jgi:hypothetical protein